jgi:CubicO group peptidase (beta-lactamase class C family)
VDINSRAAYKTFDDVGSLGYRSYRLSNRGAELDGNHPEFPLPRVSGLASADSLARFYALLAGGGHWAGFQVVPHKVCEWAGRLLVQGYDEVLQTSTAFSAGFMKDPVASHNKTIHLFNSSPEAFGHPGEGGTFAFGDPGTDVGFAYVANQMDRSLLPAEKALSLSRPFYRF